MQRNDYNFQLGDYVQPFSKKYLPNEVYYIAKICEDASSKKYVLCKEGKLIQPLCKFDIIPLEIERYFSPDKNGYERVKGKAFASIETIDIKKDYPMIIGKTAWVYTSFTVEYKDKIYYGVNYIHELQHIFKELGLSSNLKF